MKKKLQKMSTVILTLVLLTIVIYLNFLILEIFQLLDKSSIFSILKIFSIFGSTIGLLLRIILLSFYFKFSIEIIGCGEVMFTEVLSPVIFSMVIVMVNMILSIIKIKDIYTIALHTTQMRFSDVEYLLNPKNLWKLNIRNEVSSFFQIFFLAMFFMKKKYFSFLQALIIFFIGLFFVEMFPFLIRYMYPQ